MKIAFYVPSWPPGSVANGIVTYAAELVPALRRLGHEVHVLTSHLVADAPDGYTTDLSKIPVRRSPWARAASRVFRDRHAFDVMAERLADALKELKARHGIDVLEIEESYGWSLRLADANLVPVVVRLHGPWFLNGRFDRATKGSDQTRTDLEGRAIDAATLVTAPTADVLGRVRSRYNLDLSLARVIPNPINVDCDTVAWQLSACDTERILYVGRFDRRKGGDIVLRAFAALADSYPDLRLSFVGPDGGICQDGARLSFEQFVHENLPPPCRARIDFYGELPHREVMKLRHEHFFTIVASQFEILPYAVLEAMSLGCAVIASAVGGIPELITHERNGLLFESQDVAQLVSACRRLLDNPALASSLGSQARKDCIASFNPRQAALRTISAYEVAIEQNGRERSRTKNSG
jgi:glycosyltransferase involved in cell wall biosynthesis